MGTQIGLTLDDNLLKKIHKIQAKRLKKSVTSVSLARIINDLLRQHLK